MSILKQIAAIYLIAVSALAGLHWIITPLYDNSSGDYPVWVILNWFMASTIIVALDRNIRSKLALRGSDPDAPLTGRRVQANLLFLCDYRVDAVVFLELVLRLLPSE